MVATHPANRIGAHFDSPPVAKPALPKTERERGKLWSDVVFDAVLALHNQLNSRSEAVVAAAANTILELERTRIRHSKDIAGSSQESDAPAELDPLEKLEPLPGLRSKPRVEKKPKVPKPTLPPAPANPLDDATLMQFHAQDAMADLEELHARIPGHDCRPVTLERAEGYVRSICNTYDLKLSQIPPGEFVWISKAMIEWECAND